MNIQKGVIAADYPADVFAICSMIQGGGQMANSVLIVDDEPRITAALMLRLQAAGYEVFHAINGLAGWEATRIHRPDVIILDVRMPDIDGFELCRRIKADDDLASTRIVFLTANAQESARKMAYQVGGSGFLSKPYDSAEVIATIERVVDGHSANVQESKAG